MSRSLVSVVVPTRNSARTLETCLKSVRSQSYNPIELIVVDNGSADETLKIAGRHADAVESCGPERSAQRNRGAKVAHGEYFLFIDSDMTLSQGVVSDCVEAIELNGAPAVVIPEVSVGEGFLARCRTLERSCYAGDNDIEAARFFARQAFEASGGFDENLTGPEDWDLSIRIAAGNQLPRAGSQISHDEGRLRLAAVLAKKRYYAASSLYYWHKHRRSTLSQANLVFRPAFLRNWRRLLRHPVLTVGFLSLKGLEAVAGMSGILETQARSRTRHRPIHPQIDGGDRMEADDLRSTVKQALADVEGWLFFDEAWALHEAVRNLNTDGQAPTVVEIGSWKGRSTVAMALGIKARGTGIVFAIDPHTGSPDKTAAGPVLTATEFQRNIAAAGVDSLVRLLVTTSHAARPQFTAKSVDLLFIDGSHEYEDVLRDINDWQTALKDESVVAFNDPSAPGVYRALRELVLRPPSAYRSPSLVLNTLFFEFRRATPWESRDALALLKLRTVLRLKFHATPLWPYIPRWFVRIGHATSRRMVGRSPGV